MINCRKIWLFETTLSDPFFIGAKDGITCTMTDQNTIDVLDITSVMYRMNSVVKGSVEYSPTYGGEAVNPISFYGRNQYSFSLQFNLPLYDADNLSLIWGRSYAVIWEQNDGVKKCVFGQFKSQRLTVDNLYIQRVTIDSSKTNAQIYDVTTLNITEVVNDVTCFNSPFSPPDDPQPTPTNLTAVANLGDIDLSWDDNATTETGFQIERSLTSGSGFAILDTTLPSVSTYKDTTVIGGTEYFYRVKALGVVDSSYSNEATDTALLAFTTTWKTDNSGASASDSITLPLISSGTYNFTVDWKGDGTDTDSITVYNQSEVTHQYTEGAGTYEIKIYGICKGWSFGSSENDRDPLKLIEISQFSILQPTGSKVLEGCSNLNITATDAIDLSQTSTLESFFDGCSSLVFNSSIDTWDVSVITSLKATFDGCSIFNIALPNWDTSNVSTLQNTFANTDNYDQSLSTWDVSNVTNFNATFARADVFNSSLLGWVTDSATTMEGTFERANLFNQPVDHFNMSGVLSTFAMFAFARDFNQSLSGFERVGSTMGNVTQMNNMFIGATDFNQDISDWDYTGLTSSLSLNATSFSTANLDLLYNAMNAQAVNNNVVFTASGTQYTIATSGTARTALVNDHSWTITDGGGI